MNPFSQSFLRGTSYPEFSSRKICAVLKNSYILSGLNFVVPTDFIVSHLVGMFQFFPSSLFPPSISSTMWVLYPDSVSAFLFFGGLLMMLKVLFGFSKIVYIIYCILVLSSDPGRLML